MDCPENEVRVFYKVPEFIRNDYDEAIEKALFPLGLKRWASGINYLDGTRDLAFCVKSAGSAVAGEEVG